jgi:hypothetical protein
MTFPEPSSVKAYQYPACSCPRIFFAMALNLGISFACLSWRNKGPAEKDEFAELVKVVKSQLA